MITRQNYAQGVKNRVTPFNYFLFFDKKNADESIKSAGCRYND